MRAASDSRRSRFRSAAMPSKPGTDGRHDYPSLIRIFSGPCMALTTEYTLTERQNAMPPRSPDALHFSKRSTTDEPDPLPLSSASHASAACTTDRRNATPRPSRSFVTAHTTPADVSRKYRTPPRPLISDNDARKSSSHSVILTAIFPGHYLPFSLD